MKSTKEISKIFGYPFDRHTETDICFVNGVSECGCKIIDANKYGSDADVVYIKLCKKHKKN